MGCLKEAGVSDLKSLVKVTVYLTNVASMAEVSACRSTQPARAACRAS
jgi:enamine deaminase RidA (YjgF/YER057c/UK114 family)